VALISHKQEKFMRENFKTIGLLLAMSIVLLGFVSCNNEPDAPQQTITSIKAENVIGNTSGVVTIKLGDRFWQVCWYSGAFLGERYEVFAETPFVNNGFVLTLPEYIIGHSRWVLPDDAVVTNRDARLFRRDWLEGFDENGNFMGNFFFRHENAEKRYNVHWTYADRPYSVRSKETLYNGFVREHNVQYQKGWSLTYFIVDFVNETILWTTEKPTGVEFQWYFERSPRAE